MRFYNRFMMFFTITLFSNGVIEVKDAVVLNRLSKTEMNFLNHVVVTIENVIVMITLS